MARDMVNFTPIDNAIAEIRAEAERNVREAAENFRKSAESMIQQMIQNRQVAATLHGAGLPVVMHSWKSQGTHVTVRLGFVPWTKAGNAGLAAQVRKIREILGCRVEVAYKHLADTTGKLIRVNLHAKDYPGISIDYTRKYRKPKPDSKVRCRIVTVRTPPRKELVCETVQ